MIDREQAGFCFGFSYVDYIKTVQIIVGRYAEFTSPLYLHFIDFMNAFDSLNKECISDALHRWDFPEIYIKLPFIAW